MPKYGKYKETFTVVVKERRGKLTATEAEALYSQILAAQKRCVAGHAIHPSIGKALLDDTDYTMIELGQISRELLEIIKTGKRTPQVELVRTLEITRLDITTLEENLQNTT